VADEELVGNTLTVYAYVAKEGKPVGTRDVTRGANLSSSSVAHRHLQKLEALGLLEKNEYGNYLLKEKTSVSGHVWVGRNLVPRLIFYSFFFMGAFSAEIAIILLSYLVGNVVVETSFLFLTGMTAIAMALFLAEGLSLGRKSKPKNHADNAEK
jgi:repressor of nif and glnA expression